MLMRFRTLVYIGLSFFRCIFASLPSAEVEALREIFQSAKLQWKQGQDPCTLAQVGCDKHNQTVIRLRFTGLNITSLPESIGQLKSLQTLRLPDNNLVSLPESFGQLHSLGWLFLNQNQFTAVPGPILRLSSLALLDLSGNALTSLPEALEQWQSLELLLLHSNELVSLPESLIHLRSLSQLDLKKNGLLRLPDSIGRMESLNALYLTSNQLTELPDSIGQLRQLSLLHLESNWLVKLPESIGDLQLLQRLNLKDNHLTSLPDSIGDLQSLLSLGLQSNQLTALPESISGLQSLRELYASNNQLTALPASIGNLSALEFLILDSNRLSSLPESMGKLNLFTLHLDSNRLVSLPHLSTRNLKILRAANNQMTSLPDFGNKTSLQVLSLHDNFLDRLSQRSGSLTGLRVMLLHANRISDPTEICNLGLGLGLETLYLHRNALSKVPPCLGQFKYLQVLTLHRNALAGEVPENLVGLANLKVLTLHGNRLHGSLPPELGNAPKLIFFSAHSNHLVGPIPPLNIRKDCVDDESFTSGQDSCYFFSLLDPVEPLGPCRTMPDVALHCPRACKMCANASARGPILLLHDNRLSCSLPEEVTSWPKDVRSISLIGNMLGNGSRALPQWIHTDEHQPFLYLSGNTAGDIFKRAVLLASICTVGWLLLVGARKCGHIWMSKAGIELTRKAHRFLFQMCGFFSILAMCLLVPYLTGANYYTCGDSFSSTTVGNFSSPYHGNALIEWAVVILWAVWVAVGAFFLRRAPTPRVAMVGETMSWLGYFLKFVYSCCWLCIVAVLSFPSVAYAVVSAIPHNNTMQLSAWWLQFFHYQAALVMVLVDMFITPKAVAFFADATGLRRSMLLMAARLGTMWLAAVLSTIYLTTHCMNGWTHLWKVSGIIWMCFVSFAGQVCDDSTEDYKFFNISLGDNPILEPKADLCSAKESWWSDSACPRAVVNTMAPLLVSKMITRAFVQPIITLLRWQMSYPEGGQLYMLRGLICTSRSLEHGQQASLLVTWAEVALLWGAFVPILLPSVLLATGTNMLMCKVGHGHFGVEHVARDKTATGMSRRYLHGSLCALVCFQNWFAWSSGMHGRWLLLLTALLYALELGGFLSFCPEQRRRRVAILDANLPDPPEA